MSLMKNTTSGAWSKSFSNTATSTGGGAGFGGAVARWVVLRFTVG
jgi:hypothetical protein